MDCYLLAGGSSRRMGRSKLDLPFGGSTFLARVLAASRAAFERVVAVQRARGEAIAGVETIYETEHEECAPVFGVARALADARGRCFVLAIDYPLITAALLSELRDRFAASSSPMLVPMARGRAQVLCAGYSRTLAPVIDARLAAGRYDLRGLIDEAAAEIIAEDDWRRRHPGEPLLNVNTIEDLEEAEAYERQGFLASR
jgi:molybdopterin-guanine dinucleotide biosynthesis protein A